MSKSIEKIAGVGTAYLGRLAIIGIASGIASAAVSITTVYMFFQSSIDGLHLRISDTNAAIEVLRSDIRRELDIRLQQAAMQFDSLQPTEFASVISDRIQSRDLFVSGSSDPQQRIAIISISYSNSPSIVIARLHKASGEVFYRYQGQFYSENGQAAPADVSNASVTGLPYVLISGYRTGDPNEGTVGYHEIYATADGVVSAIGQGANDEIVLSLQHEFGIQTRYTLSDAMVALGDEVARGEKLGRRQADGIDGDHQIAAYEVSLGGNPIHSSLQFVPANRSVFDLSGAELEEFREMLEATNLVAAVAEVFSSS